MGEWASLVNMTCPLSEKIRGCGDEGIRRTFTLDAHSGQKTEVKNQQRPSHPSGPCVRSSHYARRSTLEKNWGVGDLVNGISIRQQLW